jgi:cell division initiation protein
MAITPVEIHHLQIGRGLLGYRRSVVDRYLTEIEASYSAVWRDRADLQDRVEFLESEVQRHREVEALLRQTLVSAEKTAQDQIEAARQQAQTIVAEAHTEARAVGRRAQHERERLETDVRRLRALLRSALEAVEEAEVAEVAELKEPAQVEGEVHRLAG